MAKLPSSFNQLSIEELYEKYGKPEEFTITQRDGKPLPPNVPEKAVIPLYLGIPAKKFSLSDSRVLLSDFGEAFDPVTENRRGEDCHTPFYARPPEARFEPQAPLTYSADIWSLAVAIWEILGMKAIFSMDTPAEDEIISQWIDVLGPMPQEWYYRWEKRSEFFDDDAGRPTQKRSNNDDVWLPLDKAFEESIQECRREDKMGEFDAEETAAILDLMRRMLAYRPEERLTADDVLRSEWMTRWALPEAERALNLGEVGDGVPPS